MSKCKFKVGDMVFTRRPVMGETGDELPMGTALKVVGVDDPSHIVCERSVYVNGYSTPLEYRLSGGDIKKGV